MELKFRKLKSSEIEVRIGSTTKKTYSLLLYKDARVDMALLDEVVGKGNWQREHKILGNDIYCRVGIFNKELNCWVWVEDAGSSGSIEVEKSKASDSFKRACVNLGIGRELYTCPEIKIWKQNENDDSFKYDRYYVKEIDYKGNEISHLVICKEDDDKVVFSFPKTYDTKPRAKEDTNPVAKANTVDENAPIRKEELEWLFNWIKEATEERYANFQGWLKKSFKTDDVAELTASQGIIVCARLGKK